MPITRLPGESTRVLDDDRMWALRAAQVGVFAGLWLYAMGLWLPFWTFFGSPGLGVSFPFWPVLIVDATCGFIAMLFCSARAWNHQPAILSWLSALLGVGTLVVGALFSIGPYEILTLAAGALLVVSSVVSALEIEGPIFEAPPFTWGGHPTFVSAHPTDAELRVVRPIPYPRDDDAAPSSPERFGVVGDDAHRHEKPEHTAHVGLKSDEEGIADRDSPSRPPSG